MEISTDGYLHKKFKKQLNTDHMQIVAKEQNVVKCVQNKPFNSNSETITVIQNTNDVVPNFSTNNENIFLGKSSISHVGNSLAKLSDGIGGLGNSQSFNNCISYVISNSDRIDDINQDHSQNRAVNFDRRFNILETISIPRVETSSILDNVYSNQYVTSKLVSVENIGDISSSSNIANYEHVPNAFDDSSYVYERNADNQASEPGGITEKSPGGKYVCSYCNLACSKPSVLQKHIRAHTNERPYPCVSCGFSFKTRSNLYKHCRSRTHANRLMGNKAQEIQIDGDSDSQSRMEYLDNSVDDAVEENIPPKSVDILTIGERNQTQVERRSHDLKTKPYKPRFHTAKAFYEDVKDNQRVFEDQRVPETVQNRPSNSQLLSLHINDVISKNNAIVNSDESYILKKRPVDSVYVNNHVPSRNPEASFSQNFNTRFEEKRNDEPLNLTNKIRKRCISEVTEPTLHTSLIKELLIKNLYSDPNMQCPHCKMIFQTVTELELHKLRSCKAIIKSGARYSRSSSVNVASILTKNKNAFDSIPHLQNTVFPLKSPGPFLGKTRLVESDKTKSFSFDDSLSMFRSSFHNHDILKATLRSSISSLAMRQDSTKRTPVKLFGGQVEIAKSSGETKSFKIDKEPGSFTDYNNRMSENRVIQSSLQSGGTVLQNTPSYNSKQDSLSPSPNVIRVFENNTLSPSIDITNLEKNRFNFDRVQPELTESSIKTSTTELGAPITPNTTTAMYNYTDIMDFSQKAAQLLAPNLKQPNFTIPGIPVPSRIALSHSSPLNFESKQDLATVFEPPPISRNEFVVKPRENEQARHIENLQFAQNQIFLQQRMCLDPPPSSGENPNMCNPVNLLVNGKVVRYVPGMPGPVAADIPLDVPYVNNNHTPRSNAKLTETPPPSSPKAPVPEKLRQSPKPESRSPILSNKLQVESERVSRSPKTLEVKTNELQLPRLNELRSPNNPKSPPGKNSIVTSTEASRKFARPNTLALKPSTAALKQHHGLTPTMFNQILISPDTPRVAKKYIQHFLHGNYFSYLGLKCSTKSVYCTLNKTQPSYVPHFKKLSMYSEWRQQETKGDKLYASAYDSRQRTLQRYVTAGRASADLVVHSSYKSTVSEDQSTKEDDKTSSLLGGYESNEEYTYVRGRGRGRYVCDQCGIRCKKPSMLKKHVRTHTNDRPYTCSHCNFSFKTKGNLTKHMKSKAHTKNYAASNSSNSSAQQSGTPSSESDSDDSGMDSSDESTRQQEHEAAYGLLSLSQKPTQNITGNSQTETTFSSSFMNAERVTQVNNSNYAKNKFLDKHITFKFNNYNVLDEFDKTSNITSNELQNITQFLGKTNIDRPLTYPYTSDVINDNCSSSSSTEQDDVSVSSEKVYTDLSVPTSTETRYFAPVTYDSHYTTAEKVDMVQTQNIMPMVKVNDKVVLNNITCNGELTRKRHIQEIEEDIAQERKYQRINTNLEAIDLSMTSAQSNLVYSDASILENDIQISSPEMPDKLKYTCKSHKTFNQQNGPISNLNRENKNIISLETPATSCNVQDHDRVNINYVIQENSTPNMLQYTKVPKTFSPMDYDNSAMETLADVATKQVKLEKHILAKNVASEFIKLTAKRDDISDSNYLSASPKEVNDLLGKPEENKSCTICDKNFSKPSQLRLHMNIHYLERPFRCDPCSTSFRTKGHLQKHERSAGHHNKLSSPLLSSSEPRPFKCTDCSVGFRIHGHLAKHLRSKQHIMKLEWLAKIPIGLYAELERSSNLLTEINTTDADQCLESLKALARKLFINNPSQPNHTNLSATFINASDS